MRLAQILFTGSLERDHPSNNDPLTQAVTYAKHAEALGWDEVWTTEHNFNPHVVNPCAMTLSSYLLVQTEQLVIGTGVVILPHTHPVRLAAQASLLQRVSGGRFRLGLGRGSQTLELNLFGRGSEAWRSGFPQALGEVKQLLETGEVQAGVPLVPHPAATPLVVAVTSEVTVQSAAMHGLPFIISFHFPDEFKRHFLDVYQKTAACACKC